jgi:hypothetical protein
MTAEEAAHVKRMVEFAKQRAKNMSRTEPLTPEQFANALRELKKKFPDHLPKNDKRI